jgi:hypothetical protein
MKARFKVLLPLALLLVLPVVVQAQFNFTINNGAVTITGYTGPGGDVTIPDTINGYPVTSIDGWTFYEWGAYADMIEQRPVLRVCSRGACPHNN